MDVPKREDRFLDEISRLRHQHADVLAACAAAADDPAVAPWARDIELILTTKGAS